MVSGRVDHGKEGAGHRTTETFKVHGNCQKSSGSGAPVLGMNHTQLYPYCVTSTSYLASLSLCFLTCKMGLIKPGSYGV